jgi:hypothetical protein
MRGMTNLILTLIVVVLLSLLVVVVLRAWPADPVLIEVGAKNEVTITVPTITRADLIDIISTFLARGTKAEEEFRRVFNQSPEITLILTTKGKP